MQFRYPALIKLDNTTLTDESRMPLKEDRDERSSEVRLASGRIRKFIKGIRKTWDISWDNVGMSAGDTIDGFAGRNEIRSLAQTGGTLTLTIQDGRNAAEQYEVFVNNYSDEVVMRHGPGQMFRYKVTLSLIEAG